MNDTKKCNGCSQVKSVVEFRILLEKRSKNPKPYTCSLCKLCERVKSLERYNNNRETNIQKNKEYKKNNREKINQTRRAYIRETMKVPEQRLKRNMKSLISGKLKKTRHTGDYLGAPMSLIVRWFEFNFEESMNWSNYGSLWEVDHVMPIASFDLTNEYQSLLCFCWMNLMPRLCNENRIKSSKIMPYRIFLQEYRLRKFCNRDDDLTTNMKDFIKKYSSHFFMRHA